MHTASRRAEGKRSSATAEVRPDAFLLCVFVLLLSWCSHAFSAPSEGLTVLKISPQDRTAVVRGNDGKMNLVKEKEALDTNKFSVPGKNSNQRAAISDQAEQKTHILTVIEIAEGRIVLEEQQGDDKETVIIRLKDGKQMVERIRNAPPAGKPMKKPSFSTQQSVTGKSNRKSSIN